MVSQGLTQLGIIKSRFGVRTLFGLVTTSAIITVVAQWIVSLGISWEIVVLIVCLAVGSFMGITVTAKSRQSTLAGAIVGATISTVIYPGLLVLYLSISFLLGGAIWGFGACMFALLAAATSCYERTSP